MSWSGFKKNVSRGTTTLMMKTGHVERTTDREFEVEERRYRTLESASLRLQKEAKGYLDSLRAMTVSQMRIAETIDAFYGDSGATDGVSRSYKQAVEDLDAETVKALDGPYRTTVLEPINRFCAYFPDINECIKKRNHKMLDYDAMRSKVKKLVEKPDKDPSKLPRTEKETEMVMSAFDSVRGSRQFPDDFAASHDVMMSPPPQALDGLKHEKRVARIQADEEAALGSVGIRRRSSVMRRVSRASTLIKNTVLDVAFGSPIGDCPPPRQGPSDPHFPLRSPAMNKTPPSTLRHSGHFDTLPVVREASKEAFNLSGQLTPTRHSRLSPNMQRVLATTPKRHTSMPLQSSRESKALSPLQLFTLTRRDSFSSSAPSSKDTKRSSSISISSRKDTERSASAQSGRSVSTCGGSSESTRPLISRAKSLGHKTGDDTAKPKLRVSVPTPFFQPSELEDIMAPFRQKFAEEQADLMEQAKAAYEQLNQQLTDELPQLIDLRVPYLDPSFEALVKIQLRFCAEAYSRMAQVQQYLDASTRDQYASGDLDARVEDVLGQIRELSIAGTV
ncbi:unnamed protein product [Cercospora beticola]|nr:unnamed protein product [Cercospora beticola]